jgi:hypothetical protein
MMNDFLCELCDKKEGRLSSIRCRCAETNGSLIGSSDQGYRGRRLSSRPAQEKQFAKGEIALNRQFPVGGDQAPESCAPCLGNIVALIGQFRSVPAGTLVTRQHATSIYPAGENSTG